MCCPDDISDKAAASVPQRAGDDPPVWGPNGNFQSPDQQQTVIKPEERGK